MLRFASVGQRLRLWSLVRDSDEELWLCVDSDEELWLCVDPEEELWLCVDPEEVLCVDSEVVPVLCVDSEVEIERVRFLGAVPRPPSPLWWDLDQELRSERFLRDDRHDMLGYG